MKLNKLPLSTSVDWMAVMKCLIKNGPTAYECSEDQAEAFRLWAARAGTRIGRKAINAGGKNLGFTLYIKE